MKINLKKKSWILFILLILTILTFSVINTKKNLDAKSNQIEFLETNLNKKKCKLKMFMKS